MKFSLTYPKFETEDTTTCLAVPQRKQFGNSAHYVNVKRVLDLMF